MLSTAQWETYLAAHGWRRCKLTAELDGRRQWEHGHDMIGIHDHAETLPNAVFSAAMEGRSVNAVLRDLLSE